MHAIAAFLSAHWLDLLAVAFVLRVAWVLAKNEDLQAHWKRLGILGMVVFGAYVVGASIGSSSGHAYAGRLGGILLACIPLYVFMRMLDQAFNDFLGGFLFELIFSEGIFAEKVKAEKKLPSVSLLRHWREHGEVNKSYRAARRCMVREDRAFPHWLFAAETAAIFREDVRTATRMVREMHRRKLFSPDQRVYAAQQLKGWAATRGIHIDTSGFKQEPTRQKCSPFRKAMQLREEGRFGDARSRLEALLQQQPDNLAAGLLLMRVLAQDLQNVKAAENVLARISNEPFTSEAYIEFARRSIGEWAVTGPEKQVQRVAFWRRFARREKGNGNLVVPRSTSTPMAPSSSAEAAVGETPAATPAISVIELLKQGGVGTALDLAEKNTQTDPESFEARQDLLLVLTHHAVNLKRARKIVGEINGSPRFTAAQKAAAKQMLDQAESASFKRTY